MLLSTGVRKGPSKAQWRRAQEKARILRNPLGFDAPQDSRGPGLTEPIGPRAGEMLDILTDPTNIRRLYGDRPFLQAQARRKALDDAGARGKYTGCPGLSRGGDMQYMGRMPLKHFLWMQGTDPQLFLDDRRLEHTLHRMELGNRAV